MRKVVFFILTFTLSLLIGTSALAASSTVDIDSTESKSGIVKVKFNTGSEKKIKLLIKNGDQKYYYNLSNEKEYVNFPLQLGDGRYTATIYENTSGTKYRKVHTESFKVKIDEEKQIFLGSIQEINWNEEDEAIKLANQLVVSAQADKKVATNNSEAVLTDDEKIKLMYDYVVANIDYDYVKITQIDYSYLPDIDSTLETGTGICYDYSSLLASMLRSQGVPTKLVKGYTSWTSVYHAWNEIYLADEDRWVVVDTTYDAYLYKNGSTYDFEKDTNVYTKSKEF